VLGIIMAGWASNSHYPLMGALRSSSQMVSYEIAMGLAVISVVLMTSLTSGVGTLSMIGIVEAQQQQHIWFLFRLFPFGLIAFFVFAVAMIAETNRAPFDLPEAESELVAGFHTEYSGFRWSLFFLAEYAAMIAVSSIAVTLWFGGWLRPFSSIHGPQVTIPGFWEHPPPMGAVDLAFSLLPAVTFFVLALIAAIGTVRMPKHPVFRIQRAGLAAFALALAGIGALLLVPPVRDTIQDIYWFCIKVAVFMYLYIWYRGTFPRYRFDQLMKLGWKVMIPMGLGVLVLVSLFPALNIVW